LDDEVPCVKVLRVLSPRAEVLGHDDLGLKCADDVLGDLVLDFEDVLQAAIV
jgi:hypothetical protein